MTDKLNSNSLINEKELSNSYSQYIYLLKKYIDNYKDKNIHEDSNIELKSLILEYLNFKYENGEIWIRDLIQKIIKKKFVSKEILISIFNCDIYDLIIKPKCLNINLSEKVYPQSNFFSYKIIKNNEDLSSPTLLYKIKRQETYELFEVIKKQFEYDENPFNTIINEFINSFLKVVQHKNDYLEKIQDNKDFNIICLKIFNDLKDQINEFITFLIKCITLFYKINNIMEYDTYYALLISIIFNGKENSENLYQSLKNIIKKKEKNKIINFKKILLYHKNKNLNNPEDFSVEDKFCLNEKSKKLYEKIYKQKYYYNYEQNFPFENTIKDYKKIKEYKNPFDKLLLTIKLSKNIADEIEKFWSSVEENELKKEKLKLNIEADDFISIFKYILIKGGIEDIHCEISFIESFTSNQIKSESEWYYLSLIQVSLMQLEELKEI